MSRYTDYQYATKTLKTIDETQSKYLIIHYSCESFIDKTDGTSPRITSIAIRKFDDGQTEQFSIHKISEIKHIPFNEIDNNYDTFEKLMLDNFFNFVKNNLDKKWIHWNMRDSNYGFKAIEHRYEVLGGSPIIIPDHNKIDLASIMCKKYTKSYASHPRIINLMKLNNISTPYFLNGKEEAEAFNNKNYVKLSMSTVKKVDIFSNFLNLSIDNKLKVQTSHKEMFKMPIFLKLKIFSNTYLGKILIWFLGIFLGTIFGKIFS